MSFTIEGLNHALTTMYMTNEVGLKKDASIFLEEFQKSQAAWSLVFQILESGQDDPSTLQLRMFAAQTLRSKVNYDLQQVPQESLIVLKNSLLQLIVAYDSKSKLISVQLCVALAKLALQFLSWTNAVAEIVATLSPASISSLLQFLKVLPQELADVGKSTLTDEEFAARSNDLITDKREQVLLILMDLADKRSQNSGVANQLILDCLNSWIDEIPISILLSTDSLCAMIFESINQEETFDASIDCLCTIVRETRDAEDLSVVHVLTQQLLGLSQFVTNNMEDPDIVQGLTRLFAEAGESYHVHMARDPAHFKPLVEIILKLTAYQEDLDVVKYTFYFWFLLKQLLTMQNFKESREAYQDIYTELLRIIIRHLQYPTLSSGSVEDFSQLFDSRESEDKFKDFRYDMGDVLKDCCAVIGSAKALSIPGTQIHTYVSDMQSGNPVPWQKIEAPLFSLRTMAKEVSKNENVVLPQLMQMLVSLPEHPKIRYAATLVLGRYTEWTSCHPQFLEAQLNYITSGFEMADTDVVMAGAHALMFFCQDCSALLVNFVDQLLNFYDNVSSKLGTNAFYEVTEGICHVLKEVDEDPERLYALVTTLSDPTLQRLDTYCTSSDSGLDVKIADDIEILTTVVSVLKPNSFNEAANPVANIVTENWWPLVASLMQAHGSSEKVSERCCKFIKTSLQSLGQYLTGILSQVAEVLMVGFERYNFGCYLWVSGVLIREFIEENSPAEVCDAVWSFSVGQSQRFRTFLGENVDKIDEIPDLMEDYFRMSADILMYLPYRYACSIDEMVRPTHEAGLLCLSRLGQFEPIIACLHYFVDFYSWGFETPPITIFDTEVPLEVRSNVLNFTSATGGELMRILLNGMIFSFPIDCQSDASDLITKLIRLSVLAGDSSVSIQWLDEAVSSLANVNADDREKMKLLTTVGTAVNSRDFRRVRSGIRDFINWYSRKNLNRTSDLAT